MGHTWEIVVRLRPDDPRRAAFAFAILALPSQMLELYLIDIETVSDRVRQAPQRGAGAMAPRRSPSCSS